MLRTLSHRSIITVRYAPASILGRATAAQPCYAFSHSAIRPKKAPTFKKPSDWARGPSQVPFEKASHAPNQPETRSQLMNRVARREESLVRAGVKSKKEMMRMMMEELEQWEHENPEAAAAFDRRIHLIFLIVALPGSIYLTDWTVRCIPYGWPGGIWELHEEKRTEILRFFGLGEPAELQAQMDSTSTQDKEVQATDASGYETALPHDVQKEQR